MHRKLCTIVLSVAFLAGCGSQPQQEIERGPVPAETPAEGAAPSEAPEVPLYDNLGSYHHEISTTDPRAQQYFDQGMRLTYAFNHAEAIRAFNEAARLDPNCAICHWGVALAFGPNINAPMDSASGVAAYEAVQRALALAGEASEQERAYIEALAQRYAAVPPAERAHLDSAYARAMGEVARQYPDDLDATTLYAEARMDLRPWNYWTPTGEPYPGTEELVADLERVLERDPDHPGACHFYIHAVEAVDPERAVPCAERLAALMPGAGHIVHMPAHIYIRVGRWADAIEANEHAVHTDETFIADQGPVGVYPMFYYPHNYHFLSLAARMAGQSRLAIEAGQSASSRMDPALAAQVLEAELIVPTPYLTLVTFGKWEEVLREPMPPANLRHATALAHYARGVAFAATGDDGQASAALDSVNAIEAATDAGIGKTVLQIASHMLQGEIALRAERLDEAITHYQAAAGLEDELPYTEPPLWYHPVRHALGDALLQAGRFAEAETVFRQDLKRFPENGWSLHGLAVSLREQGKTAEADEVEQRFAEAWRGADVKLATSRF